MFKYVGDISYIAHKIIEDYVVNKDTAVDCTLGNGHDTDFLRKNFKKVLSFEIQSEPCRVYKNKGYNNVQVIENSHEYISKYINEPVDAIMYNLGFLPKGDKNITTMAESSMKSINDGLKLLSSGGIMTICIYRGHNEGKNEESCIIDLLKGLPKDKYGVMLHQFLNRSYTSPILAVIERK